MQKTLTCGIVIVLGTLAALPAAAEPTARARELEAVVRDARDGDLKADWDLLMRARARVASFKGDADLAPLVSYHLGYIDWRLSSLVYTVAGQFAMIPALDRALTHLKAAIAAKPTFAEAHALAAMCAGVLGNMDPPRSKELYAYVNDAWRAALEHGAGNPRVNLLRAMFEVYVPPQFGGNRERGFERWKESIQLLEREEKAGRRGPEPAWGHAEAWAWLGGAHMFLGQHAEARDALEKALQLRRDFWWAKAALPQVRTPFSQSAQP